MAKTETKEKAPRYVYVCVAPCTLALTTPKATGGHDSLPCYDRDGAGNSPNRLTYIETAGPLHEDLTGGKRINSQPGKKRPGHFRRLSDSEIAALPANQIRKVAVMP
jgi:hypothetical protein